MSFNQWHKQIEKSSNSLHGRFQCKQIQNSAKGDLLNLNKQNGTNSKKHKLKAIKNQKMTRFDSHRLNKYSTTNTKHKFSIIKMGHSKCDY